MQWPVFKLGTRKPETSDGITFFFSEIENVATEVITSKLLIIDDKNIEGETLGKRRLKVEGKLYNIDTAIYFLADLLKLAIRGTWFIDNAGVTFKYTKSIRAKLVCVEIIKIIPDQGTGVLIEVDGHSQRFRVMYKPALTVRYAGLLVWGAGRILYGLYDSEFKNSYRLI